MRRSSAHAGERGQSLAEFAMVTPALILVICAILEFGNLLMTQIQLQNAVREGARYAALSSCPSDSSIQTKVRSIANGLPIAISSSYTPSPCSQCLTAQLPTVKITGTYTYDAITPLGGVFDLFGKTLGDSFSLTSYSSFDNEC